MCNTSLRRKSPSKRLNHDFSHLSGNPNLIIMPSKTQNVIQTRLCIAIRHIALHVKQ
ncbi:Uncharacterized protein APZ42_004228 [Daphnia magna]|uniref:Uncharacterized protein n=1 Tax=Daphnia magna TaxID=35525 RepID=A0A164H6S9_9CRUS|nr:Uncharacterized protein APZ42_004228 [Daphnia magna]